jgi:phospholipid/cholesterol/gamma-HCH transport system substrate-binding protein
VKIDINTKARLLFVTCLMIFVLAGAIWYVRSSSRYVTYQINTADAVSGLIADAPVEFHGVEVGKVKEIRLLGPRSVAVALNIDKGAPVTSSTVATITSRGLATRGYTGYVYISLDDVGNDERPLTAPPGSPYPVIPTARSKVITLDTTISQVQDNVQVITNLLESLLEKKTIASLQDSVDSLQRITRMLADNTGKLNSLMSNTERASRRFEPLLKLSGDTVRSIETEILPEAHTALTNFAPLLESSDDTVRALRMQILPETYQALTNFNNLSTTLTGVATKVNRDPSILIRGTTPPAPGPGESK